MRQILATVALVILSGCSAAPDENVAQTDDENGEEALTTNEKAAYQFFVNKGLTHAQAAGVVGNLIQESSMIPTVKQYGGGPGRGIAQWSAGGRWDTSHHDNVVWYAGQHGVSPWSLQTQLDFIWYELTNFGYGYTKLRNAGSLTEATLVFQDDYEICGSCAQSTRIKYAQEVLAAYGGGGGGGGGCYSATLGKSMPANACVQSKYNHLWYQCNNGSWVDRWNDPDACNGVHPL